ncbi:unnamed protein product [Protopolystoma xenopodis]|uniref:Uncharacterized protein n=1 Tax=Protopolystoma xenopodis TaxID=117903 RepID=A0A448XDZ8_9PLAT|nr:unnamed protein product [Protopolystoma xenopodis]
MPMSPRRRVGLASIAIPMPRRHDACLISPAKSCNGDDLGRPLLRLRLQSRRGIATAEIATFAFCLEQMLSTGLLQPDQPPRNAAAMTASQLVPTRLQMRPFPWPNSLLAGLEGFLFPKHKDTSTRPLVTLHLEGSKLGQSVKPASCSGPARRKADGNVLPTGDKISDRLPQFRVEGPEKGLGCLILLLILFLISFSIALLLLLFFFSFSFFCYPKLSSTPILSLPLPLAHPPYPVALRVCGQIANRRMAGSLPTVSPCDSRTIARTATQDL